MSDPDADDDASPDGSLEDGALDASDDAGLDAGEGDVIDEPPDPGPMLTVPSSPFFQDRAEATGLDVVGAAPQSMSIEGRTMRGVCVLDADSDGVLDLFFTTYTDGESVLMRASGAGETRRYDDASATLGLDDLPKTTACLAFDVDGDGDDDLITLGEGGGRVHLQDGEGFSSSALPIIGPAVGIYSSAAAGDLDGDGDLDLVIGGFVVGDLPDIGSEMNCEGSCRLLPSLYTSLANHLLVWDGERYRDRTAELASDLRRAEPTLVVKVSDFDGEPGPEIYVGNDTGGTYNDRVLRRAGTRYVDSSDDLGMAYNRSGYGIDTMGITSGDVDRDGRMDHVVSDFEGNASALFICADDGFCEDESRDLGLLPSAHSLRWGNGLADFDRDGWLDLIEATGHVFRSEEVEVAVDFYQPVNFYLGGESGFTAFAPHPDGGRAEPRATRGIALFDYDDDGRLDVVLNTIDGSPLLLENTAEGGHWLRVVLSGRAPNTGAVGALVSLEVEGVTLLRERVVGEGYLGSFDPRLHFGWPRAAAATLQVRWPSGVTSEHSVDGWDREIQISEP